MRLSIFLAFLFYLGTVASTQTAHGGRFLTLRWVALAILAGISLIFWVSKQIPRKDQMGNRGAPHFTIIYLLATLLSVGIANNYAYNIYVFVARTLQLSNNKTNHLGFKGSNIGTSTDFLFLPRSSQRL